MTQPLFLRHALGFATLACLACLPAAASAEINAVVIDEVFAFKGTATDIGVQRGPGQIGGIEYRVEGKFKYPGPLDLSKSTVTFHHLLDETGGNGEMVLTTDNADLVCPVEDLGDCTLSDGLSLAPLHPSSSSKPIEGKYESPARFRPQVRVQIKRKGDEFQFNVRLDRGLSPQVGPPAGNAAPDIAFPSDRQFPQLCFGDGNRKTTDIRTAFTIFDTVNEVKVDFEKAWECSTPGRYHLRSR
jgi:hypothetical protein